MANIQCPLEEAAMLDGLRPAVVSGSQVVSYAEFHQRVARVTSALRRIGCRPGERVAILAPNGPEYLVWLLAILRLGAVCCPMNTRLPSRTVVDLLQRIDCRMLVVQAHGYDDLGDMIREVGAFPSHNLQVIEGRNLTASEDYFEVDRLGSVMSLARPATIVFTSGSTGAPKAVLHSYGNHYYNALGSNQNLPLAVGDRWLLDLPLYHVGGLGILFRCLLSRATVVMPDRGQTLDAVLAHHEVSHLSVVVTQLHRLLQQPDTVSYPSLRYIILGGSPVPLKLLEHANARGFPVFASYGCTEMASQVATTGPDSTPAQRLTSGKLLPHRKLRISDEGEIQLAGETLFMGYVEDDHLRRPLTDDGWFTTGDLGNVDEDGYLTIVGRRDNRFFSGGETIYPEEIERALTDHSGVEQAVVVPIPDEEFGQRCVAFVKSAEACLDGSELAAWLGRALPRYKVPSVFYDWPDTDLATFKIDRVNFRRMALDGPRVPLGNPTKEGGGGG